MAVYVCEWQWHKKRTERRRGKSEKIWYNNAASTVTTTATRSATSQTKTTVLTTTCSSNHKKRLWWHFPCFDESVRVCLCSLHFHMNLFMYFSTKRTNNGSSFSISDRVPESEIKSNDKRPLTVSETTLWQYNTQAFLWLHLSHSPPPPLPLPSWESVIIVGSFERKWKSLRRFHREFAHAIYFNFV